MKKISIMKTETANAKRKHKLIVTLLIFAAVFFISSAMMSVIITPPTCVWLMTNEDFINSAKSLDFLAVFDATNNTPVWLVMIELAVTVFEIAVPIFYCLKLEKRSLRSMGFTKEKAVPKYLLGLLIGAVTLSASLGLSCLFGGAKVELASSVPVLSIAAFFLLYMIQGAGEEVLVRGFLMMSLTNSMKGKHRDFWALIISSLIFAALHLANPGISFLAFVNLFLCGMMFGLLVLRTDNILIACAAHSAWNFVQGNIFGVYVSGMNMNSSIFVTTPVGNDLISGGSFGLEGGIGVTIVEAVSIVIILLLLPKRTPKETIPDVVDIPEEQK